MTDDEFDEKLTPAEEKDSLAAQAVTAALTEVKVKVLKKHKLRGDSWHRTTSIFTMNELVHNKMHRLQGIYRTLVLTPELVKEANDELDDIIAYSAFQKHVLNVDKVVNVQSLTEEDSNV